MSKNTLSACCGQEGQFRVFRLSPNLKMVNSAFVLPKGYRIRGAPPKGLVGLTGLEPVTLRLSSACSNQLSYRPLLR